MTSARLAATGSWAASSGGEVVSPLARVGLVVIVAAAAIGGYMWWSSPERQIRRVLAGVAEGFSHTGATTPLGAASAAADLQAYFAPDVRIDSGRPFGTLTGRDRVIGAAARLRTSTPAFRIELVDVQVTVGDDAESAGVDCTAVATLQDGAGQDTVDARELVMTLALVDGRWVITHASALDVLEPVTP
jgi:hypothetical protein